MKKLKDINMPNTRIQSLRNKISELMAHGLNAREIEIELSKITKPEFIRVIMDLLENPPPPEEASIIKPSIFNNSKVSYHPNV